MTLAMRQSMCALVFLCLFGVFLGGGVRGAGGVLTLGYTHRFVLGPRGLSNRTGYVSTADPGEHLGFSQMQLAKG